jgi:hypothetical protein
MIRQLRTTVNVLILLLHTRPPFTSGIISSQGLLLSIIFNLELDFRATPGKFTSIFLKSKEFPLGD